MVLSSEALWLVGMNMFSTGISGLLYLYDDYHDDDNNKIILIIIITIIIFVFIL
jgi:succinate dehydrogenase hydrophobic anchor subunit